MNQALRCSWDQSNEGLSEHCERKGQQALGGLRPLSWRPARKVDPGRAAAVNAAMLPSAQTVTTLVQPRVTVGGPQQDLPS